MEQNQGILMDSGTNELEIVEFTIGASKFGINVIKVREIINPLPITPVPRSHANVEGIIELRGEVLPVINVATAIGFPPSNEPQYDKYIVTEFNKTKMVFHVHNVSQIHRISWTQIEKPNEMYQGLETQITGIVKHNGEMILLLDFEKMVVEINEETAISRKKLNNIDQREVSKKPIFIAEDSPLLRTLIKDTLSDAGYVNTVFFENGKDLFDEVKANLADGKKLTDFVKLVITDIEMPQMDGHHLTKLMKEDKEISNLPIIIFSSLITETLKHKGEQVGATAQVSKPEIGELVQLIDQYIL
ncbi:chemotaxis protein [Gottfriedia luciferensis]|uniref:chemotaxis protein n=1 Tax=Gottfriedia luciferensis TaxID=178774 RepID=UPI000B438EBB|nr:chemotaxis protein [Gottfriedia luciferensis]